MKRVSKREDDQENEEDRPRRRGKRKKSPVLFWTLLLGGFLGIGAVITVVILLGRGGAGSPAAPLSREIRYMPDEVGHISSTNLEQVLASPAYQALRNDWPDKVIENNPFYRCFKAGEIKRVTWAAGSGQRLLILTMMRPVTPQDYKNAYPHDRWNEIPAGPYTVYHRQNSIGSAFAIPESNIVLFENQKVLAGILSRNRGPTFSEGMTKAMELVNWEKAMAAAGVYRGDTTTRSDFPLTIDHKISVRQQIVNLKASQTDLGNEVVTTVVYVCKDADSAAGLKKLIDDASAKTMTEFANDARELLKNHQVTVDGSTVTVRNAQKPQDIIHWLRGQRRTFFLRPLG